MAFLHLLVLSLFCYAISALSFRFFVSDDSEVPDQFGPECANGRIAIPVPIRVRRNRENARANRFSGIS